MRDTIRSVNAGAMAVTADEDASGFPPILTTAMAADLLHVHVEYLRRMVREDRIPAHRFPGRPRDPLPPRRADRVGEGAARRRPQPERGERAHRSVSRARRPGRGRSPAATAGSARRPRSSSPRMGAHVVDRGAQPHQGRGRGRRRSADACPARRVEHMPLDLASFASVRAFADTFTRPLRPPRRAREQRGPHAAQAHGHRRRPRDAVPGEPPRATSC